MRRRRAQKLEKKLQQFRSKDGGPDTGGTLKVGERERERERERTIVGVASLLCDEVVCSLFLIKIKFHNIYIVQY